MANHLPALAGVGGLLKCVQVHFSNRQRRVFLLSDPKPGVQGRGEDLEAPTALQTPLYKTTKCLGHRLNKKLQCSRSSHLEHLR